MEASYRLSKYVNKVFHWARVTVSADVAEQDSITVAEDVFALRGYPPGVEVDAMRSEAVDGVRYALGKLPQGGPRYEVTVIQIEDAPADTGPGDVKLAAAQATWAALQFLPTEPPSFDHSGPVFPD
ncbi:hypothetical protein [Asanoa sp. NPDC050611]|uniref:hypothetical protein n=1 Tax=Asanoa sp. NPDC050611 TaxID=3157098 RepID=UPI0033F47A1B